MSLYLGSDTSGSKILHLASGQKSLLEMKSASTDTVFHSTLEYLTFVPYVGTLTAAANSFKVLTVSAADRAAIGNKAIMIVDSNNVVVKSSIKYTHIVYPNQMYSEIDGVWYSATSMYLVPDSTTVVGPCTVYALNIVNGSYVAPVTVGNDIRISNASIVVNGVSLTDFNYVHSTPVNAVDKTANYYSRTFQLVNSNVSGGISLTANSSYSSINKGGYPIFSTQIGKSIRHLFSTTITLPVQQEYTFTYTFPVALSDSAFVAIVPFYESTATTTTLLIPVGVSNIKFLEAYIAFPAFGGLSWYYDYISVTSSGVTLSRDVISITGTGNFAQSYLKLSVFG